MFLSRHRSPGEPRRKIVCVRRIDHMLKPGQVERINPKHHGEVKAMTATEMARSGRGRERLHLGNFDQEKAVV